MVAEEGERCLVVARRRGEGEEEGLALMLQALPSVPLRSVTTISVYPSDSVPLQALYEFPKELMDASKIISLAVRSK